MTLNISNTSIKAYNGKKYHPPLSVVFHCANFVFAGIEFCFRGSQLFQKFLKKLQSDPRKQNSIPAQRKQNAQFKSTLKGGKYHYCTGAGTIFGTTDVYEFSFSYLSHSIFKV